MNETADTQMLLLRGEVIEVSQRSGCRSLTVALEPHSLIASAGVPEDTHLGDRVRVEAEIRVVSVAPELPAELFADRRRPSKDARDDEEET